MRQTNVQGKIDRASEKAEQGERILWCCESVEPQWPNLAKGHNNKERHYVTVSFLLSCVDLIGVYDFFFFKCVPE